jgi:hypothetical protein
MRARLESTSAHRSREAQARATSPALSSDMSDSPLTDERQTLPSKEEVDFEEELNEWVAKSKTPMKTGSGLSDSVSQDKLRGKTTF